MPRFAASIALRHLHVRLRRTVFQLFSPVVWNEWNRLPLDTATFLAIDVM